MTLLRFLLSDDPDNPDVLYNLGMVLSDLGQTDEAIVRLRRLVVVAPDHVNGLVALGVALTAKRERAGAADFAARRGVEPGQRVGAAQPGRVSVEAETAGGSGRAAAQGDGARSAVRAGLVWVGQVLELTGDDVGADAAYKRMLAIDEFGETASWPRRRSRNWRHARSERTPWACRAWTP